MLNIAQSTRSRYPNLCQALAPESKPETFTQYFARKGITPPKPRSVAYYRSLVTKRISTPTRKFPDGQAFQHRILVERQSPLFHFEAPDCIGDTPQFSSRGLTDWYVAEFDRLNHLKG